MSRSPWSIWADRRPAIVAGRGPGATITERGRPVPGLPKTGVPDRRDRRAATPPRSGSWRRQSHPDDRRAELRDHGIHVASQLGQPSDTRDRGRLAVTDATRADPRRSDGCTGGTGLAPAPSDTDVRHEHHGPIDAGDQRAAECRSHPVRRTGGLTVRRTGGLTVRRTGGHTVRRTGGFAAGRAFARPGRARRDAAGRGPGDRQAGRRPRRGGPGADPDHGHGRRVRSRQAQDRGVQAPGRPRRQGRQGREAPTRLFEGPSPPSAAWTAPGSHGGRTTAATQVGAPVAHGSPSALGSVPGPERPAHVP